MFFVDESVWFDRAAVSSKLLQQLRLQPLQDLVILHLPNNHEDDEHQEKELVCVLQLIPALKSSLKVDEEAEAWIHPTLLHCCRTMFSSQSDKLVETVESIKDNHFAVRVRPIAVPRAMSIESFDPCELYDGSRSSLTHLRLTKTNSTMRSELPTGYTVDVDIVYLDPELQSHPHSLLINLIFEGLESRWIRSQSLHVFSIERESHCIVLIVRNVYYEKCIPSSLSLKQHIFQVGRPGSFQLNIMSKGNATYEFVQQTLNEAYSSSSCPGYEILVSQLMELLQIEGPTAPTGVLLTGCNGVGKTRIGTCVAYKLARRNASTPNWKIHTVSVHHLLMRACWTSEDELIRILLPQENKFLLIVDNLELLSQDNMTSTSEMDAERRLVHNALIQVVDRIALSENKVLGISQSGIFATKLPPDLVKASRLEKIIAVDPPTQSQRVKILNHMLQSYTSDKRLCQTWSELIASKTPGCVAADLDRLCLDAWTRCSARTDDNMNIKSAILDWKDLYDAARMCVPSQLADLDVTKPQLASTEDLISSTENSLRIHLSSWSKYGGYKSLKQRIYRTIVVPWKIHLGTKDFSTGAVTRESPPSGVLFHGPPGSGKSFAAICLGSSLGLPMINVRASDVLEKYLGGSEAVIRSLFTRARASSPSILLFDEVDSIACNRSRDGDGTGIMPRILSTLLNEMDGVSSGLRDSVLVVACTNRLETLDTALLRPGRLEEHIQILSPLVEDAEEILKLKLSKITIDERVNLSTLAMRLVSNQGSAAEIKAFARKAILVAFRRVSSSLNDNSDMAVLMADFKTAMLTLKL